MKNSNKNIGAFALLFFVTLQIFAAPVSLDFKGASVSDVVQTLVDEVLHLNYVMSPDVVNLDRRVTLSIKGVQPENLMPIIEASLLHVMPGS
jgi:uncharacterized protein related to proFAR isomerase